MTPEERMYVGRCKNDIQRNHLEYIIDPGVSIIHVIEESAPSTPEWSYSIGLWHNYQHPEVVIIGLRSTLAQTLINNLNYSIKEEQRTFKDESIEEDVIPGFVCYFKKLETGLYADWLLGAEWFYGDRSFPAVQMLWPNTSGVYPWDEQADEYLRWVQPILTDIPHIAS